MPLALRQSAIVILSLNCFFPEMAEVDKVNQVDQVDKVVSG